MTFSELAAYAPGTVLEAGKLLPTVTSEPFTHEILFYDSEKQFVTLETRFFGVLVGKILARPSENDEIKYTLVQDKSS